MKSTPARKSPPAIKNTPEPRSELPIDVESNTQVSYKKLKNQENGVHWKNQCIHMKSLGPTADGILGEGRG